MTDRPASLFDALPATDLRIVRLLLAGYSRQHVARVLRMHRTTLRVHLLATRRRVGCGTTAELLQLAIAHGVEPESAQCKR